MVSFRIESGPYTFFIGVTFDVNHLVMCRLGLGSKPRLGPGLEGLTALVRVRPSLSRQGGLGLGSAYGWATAFEKVLMEFTYYPM
jgi:hypothetical protein